MVLPGDAEPLLGVIPIEEMSPTTIPNQTKGGDVLIHPARQELIVNPEHPNVAQLKLK